MTQDQTQTQQQQQLNPPYVAIFFHRVPITFGLFTLWEFEARFKSSPEILWAKLIDCSTGETVSALDNVVSEKSS